MTDKTIADVLKDIQGFGSSIYDCIGHIRHGANVNQGELWSACETLDSLMATVRKAIASQQAMAAQPAAVDQAAVIPLDPESSQAQVALSTLHCLRSMKGNLSYSRQAGLEIVVSPELEALYVKEYGQDGKRALDVLVGKAETIASVNSKVVMKLEDGAGA